MQLVLEVDYRRRRLRDVTLSAQAAAIQRVTRLSDFDAALRAGIGCTPICCWEQLEALAEVAARRD
ncbi:hypothetical protein AN416_38140 (plasmid) [Paraburkholderia caribensis]|nr:hypothetical protein AN416_38140 [Paraburkholderia caribensis]